MNIEAADAAIVAVHLQNDIVHRDGAFGPFFSASAQSRAIVAKAGEILTAGRQASVPIFYTRVGWDAGHGTLIANSPLMRIVAQNGCLVNGTWQTEILSEVAPVEGDTVLANERVSGFAGSELDDLLRARGIRNLVIFGVATNVSVESTVRAAVDLGYEVFLVEDASSAATDLIHQSAIESLGMLATITTAFELTDQLGQRRP